MRLIKLEADHVSFKTVRFNPNGLTLIVGSKTEGETHTYNGVGKSLIVELLHFCLGANINKAFQTHLPDWTFQLDFMIGETIHTVQRATNDQTNVVFDGNTMKNTLYVSFLDKIVLANDANEQGMTFRSILPFFLRRTTRDYEDPRKASSYAESDMLLRNVYLLGLNTSLVSRKTELKQKLDSLKDLRKNFREDSYLRSFYISPRDQHTAKDPDIELDYLERKRYQLEQDRDKYKVAENYYALQKQADSLARVIQEEKNQIFILDNALRSIEKTLSTQPDIPISKVMALYEELVSSFKEETLKKMNEVSAFHTKILSQRSLRLSNERISLRNRKESSEESIQLKQKELDILLANLGESRALDQYTAIVNEISELKDKSQKLVDYKTINAELSNQEAEIDSQLSEEIIQTNQFLESTAKDRDQKMSIFKRLAEAFYPGTPAGISIRNNEGINKLRFDFDVRIQNDSSDGINEVKIFCYDMTLLSLQQGHHFKFVFHDSRLFANMDVRQRATLFRQAANICKKSGFQYIATLNPDLIEGMQDEFSPDEFRVIFDQSITLTLKDDSPISKLLGIQVDLDYEPKR